MFQGIQGKCNSHSIRTRGQTPPISLLAGQQDCVETAGLIYNGTLSVTQQGVDCQRWDSQQPHAHTYTDPARFPDATLADAANYCRAPDGRNLPWCYTTIVGQRWDYCNLETIYWGIQCEINWFIILSCCGQYVTCPMFDIWFYFVERNAYMIVGRTTLMSCFTGPEPHIDFN